MQDLFIFFLFNYNLYYPNKPFYKFSKTSKTFFAVILAEFGFCPVIKFPSCTTFGAKGKNFLEYFAPLFFLYIVTSVGHDDKNFFVHRFKFYK